MPTWKYVGKLASGQPVRGNMNADSEENVRKKLEAMSISCESVVSVAGAPDEPKAKMPLARPVESSENSPEASETEKRVLGAIAGLGNTYRVASDISPRLIAPATPPEKPKIERRETVVIGTLETITRQCEPLLAQQNGTVKHALMRNDAIGKLHVLLVVEYDKEIAHGQDM